MNNNTVYVDPVFSDEERRRALYEGQLIVYSPRAASLALCALARTLIEDAFRPLEARAAQHEMPAERYAAILGELKPAFIHHPDAKRHIRDLLSALGCDLEATYFDVPRMRSSTSDGYLTTGIAYAWHPHRDTWYSAPPCQINWWMPVYDIVSENAMAFHPVYFSKAVPNDSDGYNYYKWNQVHRGAHVAQLVKEDPRPLPRPTGHVELDPQIRLVCPVGGIVVFSGAQLHSSVPNTSGVTRFSLDFRTVNVDDAAARRGAVNVDSRCTGTTMRDYLRVTDLARIPEKIVSLYDDETRSDGRLIYDPEDARARLVREPA
jgi:hypothetical protein